LTGCQKGLNNAARSLDFLHGRCCALIPIKPLKSHPTRLGGAKLRPHRLPWSLPASVSHRPMKSRMLFRLKRRQPRNCPGSRREALRIKFFPASS
jgi:hypothetical protein